MLGKRLINSNSAASGATCTTDTLQILGDTSCVAYYKMSDATDESGNYDGTPTSVNFNVAGKFGNAGEFNGSSSKMVIPSTVSVSTDATDFNRSLWLSTNSAFTSYRGVIGANGNNSPVDFAISNVSGNTYNLTFIRRYGGTYYGFAVSSNFTLLPTTFYHLSINYRHSPKSIDLYINGSLVSTTTTIAFTGSQTAAAYECIGQYNGDGNYAAQSWNGKIDQVRIFNKALSSTEVTTLYNEVYCVPTIVPTDYFNTVLYTGDAGNNGNTLSKTVTGVGFQPDFVWGKSRNAAVSNVLFDSVRGAEKWLNSDNTNAEANNQYTQATFLSDGFTTGTSDGLNKTNIDFVAWNWKAGGADVLNEDGTIDSQVSANVDAGFSVVSYTGSGSGAVTVGHGLDIPIEMYIVKSLSTGNWWTYHSGLNGGVNPSHYFIRLDLSNEEIFNASSGGSIFNSTEPTSTVFSGGTTINSSNDYIAYCFHSVDGYSKIGSYTGTGASGNSIVTGFRPAFVMFKVTSEADHWIMFDNKRGVVSDSTGTYLMPNLSQAEGSISPSNIDFHSNGFEITGSGTYWNKSGASYIFMAFAEEVFNPNGVTRNATNPFGDASELALYKFEDNANDAEGSYNGTASNVTYATGYIDKAAVFNGSTSSILLSNTIFNTSNILSFSAWVKTNDASDSWIVTNRYGTHTFSLLMKANGTVAAGDWQASANNITTTTTINNGNWHHIVYINNNGAITIYIDKISSATGTHSLVSQTVGNGNQIGNSDIDNNSVWNGSIDQVRIFDRALDSGEVTQLYNE